MEIPFFKTDSTDLSLLQTKWRAILNPLLKRPLNNVSILKNVSLISGDNKVPHLLGRLQKGWVILDIDSGARVYRNQPLNESFLYLSSNSDATVSIGVF